MYHLLFVHILQENKPMTNYNYMRLIIQIVTIIAILAAIVAIGLIVYLVYCFIRLLFVTSILIYILPVIDAMLQ